MKKIIIKLNIRNEPKLMCIATDMTMTVKWIYLDINNCTGI